MNLLEKIYSDIKEYLSEERYEHTIRVKDEAIKLAEFYKLRCEDLDKIKIASLLHDIGKSKNLEELLGDKLSKYHGLLEKLEDNNAIYHADMSVSLAQELYSIEDVDILSSIKYHTTGNTNMNMIEKIVCLADYIEPGRSFEGLRDVRRLAYGDIDRALLLSFDNTIRSILDRALLLNSRTVEARNFLLEKVKNRGGER